MSPAPFLPKADSCIVGILLFKLQNPMKHHLLNEFFFSSVVKTSDQYLQGSLTTWNAVEKYFLLVFSGDFEYSAHPQIPEANAVVT